MRDPEIWRFPALQDLKSAWQRAQSEVKRLPTLAQLNELGAPVDHNGMGIVGEKVTTTAAHKERSFQFLSTGPDHLKFVGKIVAGHDFEEIMHPAHAARVTELYKSLCETKSMHAWRCINTIRNAPPMAYTRVIVPISDDVGDGRCLFGVWIWHE